MLDQAADIVVDWILQVGADAGLAVVLFRLHQYQGAQDLYARAYDIQSSKLGPEDKEVVTTMNNTAGLLKAMGKLADAEVVYRTVGYSTCYFQ